MHRYVVVFSHLDFVFLGVEAFREDVDVELFELCFQHEFVVPDADVAQRVERVRLDVAGFMSHEEEHRFKHFQHRVGPRLKRKSKVRIKL